MNSKATSLCSQCRKDVYVAHICLTCRFIVCDLCHHSLHSHPSAKTHTTFPVPQVLYQCPTNSYFHVTYFANDVYTLQHDKSLQYTIFTEILSSTRQGYPLVDEDLLCNRLSVQLKCTPSVLTSTLASMVLSDALCMTTRRFGDYKQSNFFSIKLRSLSIECLAWAVRSIKHDSMEPNLLLVNSRLREYFDLDINMKELRQLLDFADINPSFCSKANKFAPFVNQVAFEKLSFQKQLIRLVDETWPFDDQAEVSSDDPKYCALTLFLKAVFFKDPSLAFDSISH